MTTETTNQTRLTQYSSTVAAYCQSGLMRSKLFLLPTVGLLSLGLLYSCNGHNKQTLPPRHSRLLGFKARFITEEIDDKVHRKLGLYSKLRTKAVEVKRVNDILYISLPLIVNACGQYDGNVSISHDTIYLHYNLVSDEVCTSHRVDQLTYLVDNPDHAQYHVVSSLL
ncbi:hypothetical protein [Hymenobacter sp.]|jgi:hypothetical protein|uniref:hypothetical protein n=1 Tax=Hymenobacter sp. TaxID=1898978 RepID=UPI002ED80BAF